jgi:MFS-type transporter involved in bile tolerance (Atg22 family)
MTLEAVAAVVAVLLSGFSLFRQERLSRTLHNSQSERGAIQQNVSLMVSLWNRIGETPSVLRFHSITESDLQAVGLTTEELAYLVSSFEAAAHYYE